MKTQTATSFGMGGLTGYSQTSAGIKKQNSLGNSGSPPSGAQANADTPNGTQSNSTVGTTSGNSQTTNKHKAISINNMGLDGAPTELTGYTKHGVNQAISHDNLGVNPKTILETLKNPKSVIFKKSNNSFKFYGENSNVALNKGGQLITTWATSSKGWRAK